MATEASLAGMALYGRAWRARLPIKAFIPSKEIANGNMADERAVAIAQIIHRNLIRQTLGLGMVLHNDIFGTELEEVVDSFDFHLVTNHEELYASLVALYDWADFERVLIC